MPPLILRSCLYAKTFINRRELDVSICLNWMDSTREDPWLESVTNETQRPAWVSHAAPRGTETGEDNITPTTLYLPAQNSRDNWRKKEKQMHKWQRRKETAAVPRHHGTKLSE